MPCTHKLESRWDLQGRFWSRKGIPQKMRGEEKKIELQLSWKWMEGYGQGDENKFYVEYWRNCGISADLWALRDCTFPVGILTRLEAQIEGNESFAVWGLKHAWPCESGMKIIESFSLWKRQREQPRPCLWGNQHMHRAATVVSWAPALSSREPADSFGAAW